MLSPPLHSKNKYLESRQIVLFVWTGRGSRDHGRSASWHLHLHRRAFLPSACKGVCPTAAPLQEQMQDKAFAQSPIAAGKVQTALFKPLPPDLPSSPVLAPACWGLLPQEKGEERRGVTKDISREQDNPASVPQPELSSPSHPMPGQSVVIHFHLQSLYTSSAALPPAMVSQVLSL